MTNTQREWEGQADLIQQYFFERGARVDRAAFDFVLAELTKARAEGAAAERERIMQLISFEEKGYNIAAEQADTVFMQGISLEGYSLDQAHEDVRRNSIAAETIENLKTLITPTKDKVEDVSSNNTV